MNQPFSPPICFMLGPVNSSNVNAKQVRFFPILNSTAKTQQDILICFAYV